MTGNLVEFDLVMKIAEQEAELLNNKYVQSDLILFQSLIDRLQGRNEEALKKIDHVLEIKYQIKDKKGYSNCLREKGIQLKQLGKIQDAEKLYLEALESFRVLDEKKGISQSLNSLVYFTKIKERLKRQKSYI